MSMHVFQESVRIMLLESGWSPGRKIDIAKYRDLTLTEGYKWFDSAQNFLSEFGDLKIIFFRENGDKDSLHFEAMKAMADIDPTWLKEDYFFRVGNKDLCVIGQAFSNHMTLMMDVSGCVYGGFDDSLYFIGNNGSEAIETICLNGKPKEI